MYGTIFDCEANKVAPFHFIFFTKQSLGRNILQRTLCLKKPSLGPQQDIIGGFQTLPSLNAVETALLRFSLEAPMDGEGNVRAGLGENGVAVTLTTVRNIRVLQGLAT